MICLVVVLEPIDLSPAENTGLGDPLRVGGTKINENEAKLFTLSRVVQENTLQVYKAIGNQNIDALETGDLVVGWFTSTQFLNPARYNGGSVGDIASYTIINEIDFS